MTLVCTWLSLIKKNWNLFFLITLVITLRRSWIKWIDKRLQLLIYNVPNHRDKRDVKLQKRWIQRVLDDARREEKLKFQASKAKDKEKIFSRCIIWLLIVEVALTSLVLYSRLLKSRF